MKKMNFEQMENLKGGTEAVESLSEDTIVDGISWLSCAFGIAGFGLAAAGLVLVSGGTAAVLVAGLTYSIAPAAAALSCM